MSQNTYKFSKANNLVNTQMLEDGNFASSFVSTHIKLPDGKTYLNVTVSPSPVDLPDWAVCIDLNNPNVVYVSPSIYTADYIAFNDVIPVIYHYALTDNDIGKAFFDHQNEMLDKKLTINIPDDESVFLLRHVDNHLNGWLVSQLAVCTTTPPEKKLSNSTLQESDLEKLLQKAFKSIKNAKSIDDDVLSKLNSNVNSNAVKKKLKLDKLPKSIQLSFDFEEQVKENNTNMINPICKYSTLKTDEVKFVSKSYKYDNIPQSYISCSCPSITSVSDNKVSPCSFGPSNQVTCPYYQPESSLLSNYVVKDKDSNSYSYSVCIQTTTSLDKRVDIVNDTNGQITYVIGVPTTATEQEILEESDSILAEHFSTLELTLDTFKKNDSTENISQEKQKKSFILSLA